MGSTLYSDKEIRSHGHFYPLLQPFRQFSFPRLTSVSQIYEASFGIIITTAEKTKILENELEKLSERISTPVYLISGNENIKINYFI